MAITKVKIWWDDQDPMNTGWCARSYEGNQELNDEPLDLADNASDDELIAALPRNWQNVENIHIIRSKPIR